MPPKKDKTGHKPINENQQPPQEPQNTVNESPPPEKQENTKQQVFDQSLFTYHRDKGWIPLKEDKKIRR